jgi:hypothetical protein
VAQENKQQPTKIKRYKDMIKSITQQIDGKISK